jgi:SAM-dependent methyltransferase
MSEISTPAASVPSPTQKRRFYCPKDHTPLTSDGEGLTCATCGIVGRWKDGIASFLPEADGFYEGKYNNRTKYVPASDGFLATLPLRIVGQGYPTAVARELPAGATVVEIGCAGGIDWFGRRYDMIGIDLSEAALKIAAQNYGTVVQADATRLPFADGSIDGVISSCLFEHLSEETKVALLREVRRVLKPGGKVIFFYDITTENPVIAAYRARHPDLYDTHFLQGDGHIGYDTIEANRRHFDRAGLVITREAFHERTPFLTNSVWQKLSHWPGKPGALARIGAALTSGPARLPSLALTSLADATVGPFLPPRYARCLTTIAFKP